MFIYFYPNHGSPILLNLDQAVDECAEFFNLQPRDIRQALLTGQVLTTSRGSYSINALD